MRGLLLASAAFSIWSAAAESNIDPAHAVSSSDYLGEINWRVSAEVGAVINQYFCSGSILSESVGWITLSSGAPANSISFQNKSASDFGVNVSPSGNLSGFAYGANIGWISFSPAGSPRVDWSTGKFSGSAWAANAGWISLASTTEYVRIQSLADLPDSNGNGLPDAWEMQVAGSLTVLSANADTDHDGQTDLEEYLSGTNPLDPNDFVGPLHLAVTQQGRQLEFATKKDRVYRIEQRSALGYGVWLPAAAASIVGTGADVNVTLEHDSANISFYRLVAYPPLTIFN